MDKRSLRYMVGTIIASIMLFCGMNTAFADSVPTTTGNIDNAVGGTIYLTKDPTRFNSTVTLANTTNFGTVVENSWGEPGLTLFHKGTSVGTWNNVATIKTPNIGYTTSGRAIDLVMTIDKVALTSLTGSPSENASFFVLSDVFGPCTIAAGGCGAEITFTMNFYYHDTTTLVDEPDTQFDVVYWDIDVRGPEDSYPDWAEQIHKVSGYKAGAIIRNDSTLGIKDNNTTFYATQGDGSEVSNSPCAVLMHTTASYTTRWRGTSGCGTGIGTDTRVRKTPTPRSISKAPATQTKNKGDTCNDFTITATLPYYGDLNKPTSIVVSDTFDAAFDISSATGSVKQGNTNVSSNWTFSKSGQTVQFSAKNTAHGGGAEGTFTFTISGVKVKNNASISNSNYPKSSDDKYRLIRNEAKATINASNGGGTLTSSKVDVKVPFYKVHYMWQKQGVGNFVDKYIDPEVYVGAYTTKTFPQANFNQTSGYSARGYAMSNSSENPVSWQGITSPGAATEIVGETWLWATESQNPVTVHYMWKGIHDSSFHELTAAQVVRVPPGTYKTKNFVQATITPTQACTPIGYAQTTAATAIPSTFNEVIPGGNAQVNTETWFWATENWDPIPVHYMWKAAGDTAYHEVANETLTAPTQSYPTFTLDVANVTPTTGYAPVAWKKTLAGNSNPSLGDYTTDTVNPGASTEITPHETWFWATEKYNCFPVHYMWRAEGQNDFTEVKKLEDVSAGTYTILSLADAGITLTDGCTPVSYGLSDDGYPPSSLSTNAAGSTVNLQGEIWLWGEETRNTYPVHYMWKPDGASSYTQVAQEENIPYGPYLTMPFEDAGIYPTSGFEAVGYGKTNTESAPSNLNDANPGGTTQVTGETWLWASESKTTYPVHYMWRPNGSDEYIEVRPATQENPGDYTILTPSAVGISPTQGHTVVAYGMTSTNSAPNDSELSGHPAEQIVQLNGETWFWASESPNTYTVHYMFKSANARNYVEKKKVENVSYGDYTALALTAANINQSDGCTIEAYGQTTSNSAPTNLSAVEPTGNTQITSETWLWAKEARNTYPVHYMWKGANDTEYREVKTEAEVPYGEYSTENISDIGVTQTSGSTVAAYGKTTSNSAPGDNQLNTVNPGTSTNITQETWLWAAETLPKYPVHYMWKPAGATGYTDVKTVNVVEGDYQTETLASAGMSVSTGHSAKGYGKTVSNSAPNTLADLNPGDTTSISRETWLWAAEEPLHYTVHYMWKGHAASDFIEVKTDNNVPYGSYTTKSLEQAEIVAAQGYTAKGYGKTSNNTAPTNLTQVAPSSSTNITGDTWLWASEDVNTYPVHYMWKASGASTYTEVLTVPNAPYGSYQTLALNAANITPSDGCTPAAYGKTSSATPPANNSDVNPGSSFNLTGETWLWADENANKYTVHYMWKPDGATGYRETFTAENVAYGDYTTLQLSAAKITPTTGCTASAYGMTTSKNAPSSTSGTTPGSTIRVGSDIWLWASETRNTYPVHYMYSTGSYQDWKEVKVIENVPSGSYKTLGINQLGVNPEYPNLVDGYGKTTSNVVPDGLYAVEIGGTTQIAQETWLWAMEDPLIHGSQVTTYKDADPAPNTTVSAGQEITYKLKHTNTGVVTSAYTLVRDYIPANTEYVDGSVSEGGVYVAADKSANGKAYVEWVKSSIPPRGFAESSFKVKVSANPPKAIFNYALTSSQPTPITPGDPSNKEPKDESNEVQHPTSDGVKTPPQIEIVKSSVPSPGIKVSAGNEIDYTLTVTNSGGSDAKDVAVFDAVPQYTSLASCSTDFGGQAVNGGQAAGWNIPNLGVGKSVELHMKVVCTQDDNALITNQASYCRNTPGIPDKPLPNTTRIVEHPTEPLNIITGAQVTTYKSSDPVPNSKVEAGQEITYTLTHINTGAVTSAYTLVRDYIPEGVEYVDGSVSEGGIYVAAENSPSGRAYVEWVKFGIPVGAQATSSFKVKVVDNPPSIIRNHALTGSQDDPITPGNPSNADPALMSNEVRHNTDGEPCGPQIQIVKSALPAPGSVVSPGNIIVYTLEVSNIGDEVARNVGVYDDVPAMTQLIDFEAMHNCTKLYDGRALGWNIAELAPGGSTTLSFRVTVTEQGRNGQKIANCASYAMDVDGIPQSPLPNTSNIVEHPFKEADMIQDIIMATGDVSSLALILGAAILASAVAVIMKTRRKSRK